MADKPEGRFRLVSDDGGAPRPRTGAEVVARYGYGAGRPFEIGRFPTGAGAVRINLVRALGTQVVELRQHDDLPWAVHVDASDLPELVRLLAEAAILARRLEEAPHG